MTTNYGGDWVASATQHSRRLAPAVETPSVETSPAPTRATPGRGSQALRRILGFLDATAVMAAWAIALTLPDRLDPPGASHIPNPAPPGALAPPVALATLPSPR